MKKLFAVVILALFVCGAMALPSFLFMKRKRRTVGMSAFMEMPTTFPLLRHLMDGKSRKQYLTEVHNRHQTLMQEQGYRMKTSLVC